jgi:hypothetical protein
MDVGFVILLLVFATFASLVGAHHFLELGLGRKAANGALLLGVGCVLLLLTASLLVGALGT